MKVKIAAQVLSQRVAATMNFAVNLEGSDFPKEAVGTAQFCLFFDKLFDSCNGSAIEPEFGKELRSAVKATSPHHKFWDTAIQVLNTIQFFDDDGNKKPTPPCINNWIFTIKGFKYLWKKLNWKFLRVRNADQDPLENSFGGIRSHGRRNINPTCTSFTAACKTLILNNFMSPHAPGANCEEDDGEALDTLKSFLLHRTDGTEGVEADENDVVFTPELITKNSLRREYPTHSPHLYAYVAGWVAKALLKKIGVCKICRSSLVGCAANPENSELIRARAYKPSLLLTPGTNFQIIFVKCKDVLQYSLPKLSAEQQLRWKLRHTLLLNCGKELKLLDGCKKHPHLKSNFLAFFLKFYINNWCNIINKILRGLQKTDIDDDVKKLAYDRYEKYRARRRKIDTVKGIRT